jgi:site-specific DNA-cytosine methylase
MSNITHASIIPLVGGLSTSAKEVLKNDPEFALSWPAFEKNESHFRKNFPNVKYCTFSKENPDDSEIRGVLTQYGKVDILHAVPPCAGLSMLSASSGGTRNPQLKVGSDAHQNRWMHYTTDIALKHVKPKVFVFENAPGLMSSIGEGMRQYLKQKAEEYGYSMSIIFTNTLLHGIPQSRKRTFVFFWKDKYAPKFSWKKNDVESFSDYIKKADTSTQEHKIFASKVKLLDDPFMKFLVNIFQKNWRKELDSFASDRNLVSVGLFLRENNLFDRAIKWAQHNEPRLYRIVSHWKKKLDDGKGYWDSSPLFFKNHTNAIISKNIGIIHPTEDRWLSVREMMWMMGLPNSYSLQMEDNKIVGGWNVVCQNVPVCTGRDMIAFAKDFVEGKTIPSEKKFILENNLSQLTEDFR